MYVPRLRTAALAVVATLTLSACYDDGYGYGGLSVGYGSPGYYGSYYDYGYPSYYGWYDGFYYPGSGYWIYDQRGYRHRWNDHHRRYWEGQRGHWRDRGGYWGGRGQWRGRERWDDFRHDRGQWRGRGGSAMAPDRSYQARPDRATPRREGRGPRGDRRDRVRED